MVMLAKEEGMNPAALDVQNALHLLQLVEYFISEDANHIQLGLNELCEGLSMIQNPDGDFHMNDLLKFMLRNKNCQNMLRKLSVREFLGSLKSRY